MYSLAASLPHENAPSAHKMHVILTLSSWRFDYSTPSLYFSLFLLFQLHDIIYFFPDTSVFLYPTSLSLRIRGVDIRNNGIIISSWTSFALPRYLSTYASWVLFSHESSPTASPHDLPFPPIRFPSHSDMLHSMPFIVYISLFLSSDLDNMYVLLDNNGGFFNTLPAVRALDVHGRRATAFDRKF